MLPTKKTFNIDTSLNRIKAILDESNIIRKISSVSEINDLDYNSIVKTDLVYVCVLLKRDADLVSDEIIYKQYKASLSELIPILAESSSLVDIDVMDFLSVLGIYSCQEDEDLDSVIDVVAKANSMCEVLNMQFEKHDIGKVMPGIGVTIAETQIFRMTEAESKSEEILRISGGIGESMFFAKMANAGLVKNPIIITPQVWEKLSDKYKQFFSQKEDGGYYYASLINTSINNWLKENR